MLIAKSCLATKVSKYHILFQGANHVLRKIRLNNPTLLRTRGPLYQVSCFDF